MFNPLSAQLLGRPGLTHLCKSIHSLRTLDFTLDEFTTAGIPLVRSIETKENLKFGGGWPRSVEKVEKGQDNKWF